MIEFLFSAFAALGVGIEGSRRLTASRYSDDAAVKPVLTVPKMYGCNMPNLAMPGQLDLSSKAAIIPVALVRDIGIPAQSIDVVKVQATNQVNSLCVATGFASKVEPTPSVIPVIKLETKLPVTLPIKKPVITYGPTAPSIIRSASARISRSISPVRGIPLSTNFNLKINPG